VEPSRPVGERFLFVGDERVAKTVGQTAFARRAEAAWAMTFFRFRRAGVHHLGAAAGRWRRRAVFRENCPAAPPEVRSACTTDAWPGEIVEIADVLDCPAGRE
jgi:hypothetical protein